MFTLARFLPDGSTLYLSARGVRFIVRPCYDQEDKLRPWALTSLYVEGRYIFGGSRREVIEHMEEIAH
jgi:hypothetical protein